MINMSSGSYLNVAIYCILTASLNIASISSIFFPPPVYRRKPLHFIGLSTPTKDLVPGHPLFDAVHDDEEEAQPHFSSLR